MLNYLLGDPQGQFITIGGSYVRQALKDGVAMQQAEGYNPFKSPAQMVDTGMSHIGFRCIRRQP